jgi:hypothetical protein
VEDLNQHFLAFDEIVDRHGLEKLKTIGDAYMCAGGLPEPNRTHPVEVCLAALEIQAYMARMNTLRDKMRLPPWELRIGIHTGSVMAGVVGKRKFTYDIWGDAVNVAALMEANGVPGQINLSESTYHRINTFFATDDRGMSEAKNKGSLSMFFLMRIMPPFSGDSDDRIPNREFTAARKKTQSLTDQTNGSPAAPTPYVENGFSRRALGSARIGLPSGRGFTGAHASLWSGAMITLRIFRGPHARTA